MSDPTPQLHMTHKLRDLPGLTAPAGYDVRSLRASDLDGWTSLLARNGELGEWSVDRAAALFAPGSVMPLSGAFVATAADVPVATAQLHLHGGDDPYAPTPELGWVAVVPEHRGHRLGYLVCLAVLRHAHQNGFRSIFLRTDDYRVPAIRTYLQLGFEPWLYDDSAGERWNSVLNLVST
ncbi:MAG TPA: GNAT family N-acetyltransferase [Mycobacteriales bacterium]|jgi:mycothiol synthase|nr:GNAT family N-acetyltransferase [Mycobacteriales bacterium]